MTTYIPISGIYTSFKDLSGNPLRNGYVYIGLPGFNPETSAAAVYWDQAATQPAAQPLRTTNGYIARSGTPTNVFVGGNYSITVRDFNRQIVYTSLDAEVSGDGAASLLPLSGPNGSSLVGFIQAGTGAVATTVQQKLRNTAISPEDFGAVGDGVINDTTAFQLACAYIESLDGGALWLTHGKIYIVGRQTLTGAFGQGASYRPEEIITIESCANPVVIYGNGAQLKVADGLHFGSFNPVTGAVFNPPPGSFTDPDYAASVGSVIALGTNASYRVDNLQIDGNLASLVIGGRWGDSGIQLAAYGINSFANKMGDINNVYTHHNGLDGVVIGNTGMVATDNARPHTLTNVNSDYNARQGLSLVGGIGITMIGCNFNNTGRGINTGTGVALVTSPGLGFDIEAESSVIRQGIAINCQFVNNAGGGMIADSGDGGYFSFTKCLFWGTTSQSIGPNKPQMHFYDCDIYGAAVTPYASTTDANKPQFIRCRFEDVPYPTTGVFAGPLIDCGGRDRIYFEGCNFTNNSQTVVGGLGLFVGATPNSPTTAIMLKGCTFVQKSAIPDTGYIANTQSCILEDCTFINDAASQPATYWTISAPGSVLVRGVNQIIAKAAGSTGKLHWQFSTGPTLLVPTGYVGTFTLAAAASTTVSNTNVFETSVVTLSPSNVAAATLMASSKSLYTAPADYVAATSFTVKTRDGTNAAGTETFGYVINN